MKLTLAAIVTTLLAGTAMASPVASDANNTNNNENKANDKANEVEAVAEVKSMFTSATWTIRHLRRHCDHADSCCTWEFAIDDGHGWCDCKFETYRQHHLPASRAQGHEQRCGPYTVTSGWSGQFGEGNGFTTLSVVDRGRNQIAWPAYRDVQLWGGHVVKPDQSYPVQYLP